MQLHQPALGLAYLHAEGIVHGDLDAGNLLVDESGNIRLTDFGLSLIAEGTAYNYGSQRGGGAVHYTAPELFDQELFGLDTCRPTFRSDIYAFACVCIEIRSISHFIVLISTWENSSTLGSPLFQILPATRSLFELSEVTDHLDPLFQMTTLYPTRCGP